MKSAIALLSLLICAPALAAAQSPIITEKYATQAKCTVAKEKLKGSFFHEHTAGLIWLKVESSLGKSKFFASLNAESYLFDEEGENEQFGIVLSLTETFKEASSAGEQTIYRHCANDLCDGAEQVKIWSANGKYFFKLSKAASEFYSIPANEGQPIEMSCMIWDGKVLKK